jgi:L-ribulokinase
MTPVAGVDFGTAGVRVSIVHSERGRIGGASADYPVLRRADYPNFATQRHEDHLRALEKVNQEVRATARVKGGDSQAIALDTMGSTVIPLDAQLQPLDDAYLLCDHHAWREAAEITAKAHEHDLEALNWCGGTYSSEWGFAKVLHWLRYNPERRGHFRTAAEHCDLMVATLCGIHDTGNMVRSVCAMGHKWMWNQSLGGLPSEEFLTAVDPLLSGLRSRLQGCYLTADKVAGRLCEPWSERLGMRAGIPIAAGALDARWDAIGAGCRLGDVVNVIGT